MKSFLMSLLVALISSTVFPQQVFHVEETAPAFARPTPDATTGFSAFFPVVTRVQGASTFFYTTLDVTNHHPTVATDVNFTFVSSDGSIRVSGLLTSLKSLHNFHTDDLLQTFANLGVLTPAQVASIYGTLVLTFSSPTFTTGTEASAVARVFNYVSGSSGPTIGLAYRAQMMRTNGNHRLSSIVSDTNPGITGPVLLTNLGIANMGIDDAGQPANTPATLTLSFIDPRTGNTVGDQPQVTLGPGQVRQINDLFSGYNIPSDATSLIVNVTGPTGTGTPQIDGYVVLKDVISNDGSYFAMQPGYSTPTPPVTNYDGTWSGSTNEGKVVQFTIANSKLVSFKMAFSFGGGGTTCDTTITTTWSVPLAISGNGFSFTFSPTGLTTSITVTFSSATAAIGTFGQVNMTNYQCGPLTINGFKAGGTFNALKM